MQYSKLTTFVGHSIHVSNLRYPSSDTLPLIERLTIISLEFQFWGSFLYFFYHNRLSIQLHTMSGLDVVLILMSVGMVPEISILLKSIKRNKSDSNRSEI